jgi:hypothetical protein
MSTKPDCECGHKFDKHRQFSAANYRIGDDYLCKCKKYEEVRNDLQKRPATTIIDKLNLF